MNVDAAISEHARLSVDPADAGVGGDNSFQTLSRDSGRHGLWAPSYTDVLTELSAAISALCSASAGKCSKLLYSLAIDVLSRRDGLGGGMKNRNGPGNKNSFGLSL
jgi:hypothetical protein